MVAIFIRIILIWVGMDTRNPVVIFLHEITEPILAPIRRFIPPHGHAGHHQVMVVDCSPASRSEPTHDSTYPTRPVRRDCAPGLGAVNGEAMRVMPHP